MGGVDRHWLVAGPAGFVGLFYAYFHGSNPARGADGLADGRSSVQAVYSRDHGATWGDPSPVVVAPAGGCMHWLPWVAARGAREVAVGWYGANAAAFATTPAQAEPAKIGLVTYAASLH